MIASPGAVTIAPHMGVKMSANAGTQTYKLKTGKTVGLRARRINDSLEAAQSLGEGASQHPITYSLQVGMEMARRLIVEVDGKKIEPKQLLDLDALFTSDEYSEVIGIVGGGKDAPRPTGAKFENSSGGK